MSTATQGQAGTQNTVSTGPELQALAVQAVKDRNEFRSIGVEIGGTTVKGVQSVLDNLAIHTEMTAEEIIESLTPALTRYVNKTRTNHESLTNVERSVSFSADGWSFNPVNVIESIWRGAEKMRAATLNRLAKNG